MTADEILDAAGRVFAAQGIRRSKLGDVAIEAGCSRPTVYRYFTDRDALRAAFVHREARRLGARIAARVRDVDDPGEQLVRAVLAALDGVRTDRTLAAWFVDGDAAVAIDLAGSSPLIESLAEPLVGEENAAWLVRVVLSLLQMPGRDRAEERRMIERFVVPVVLAREPQLVSSKSARSGSRVQLQ